MTTFPIDKLLKPAIIGSAIMGLSACMVPGGYYGDGYVNGASSYGCDPYAPFDDYYACDDGYGYANIGFGGGWYDNFYYPGYGTYIFDRRGTRYGMKQNHRRHWARQRAEYGLRDGRNRNGNRFVNRDQRGTRGEYTRDQRARDQRGRDLTPEQRAARQERRAERRSGNSNGETVRGGNRQPSVTTPTRRGRPTMAEQQPQRRPATRTQRARPAVTAAPRQVQRQSAPPAARQAPRISRNSKEINRRDVHDE